MDFGASFAKYVLFVFNMLALLCGILIIVFGSLLVSRADDFKSLTDASIFPITIIVVGCIIAIISFMGCYGAIRENTCLTMTYSVVMLVLFVLQMIVVCYIWIQRESFIKAVNTIVDKAWQDRHKTQEFMDIIQNNLNCCGRIDVRDYVNESVPNSCCGPSATSCSIDLVKSKPGCYEAFRTFLTTYIAIAQYAGLAVAGIEMIAFIFACCIANQTRNERRRAGFY